LHYLFDRDAIVCLRAVIEYRDTRYDQKMWKICVKTRQINKKNPIIKYEIKQNRAKININPKTVVKYFTCVLRFSLLLL
jgi:hypothetical protein